MPSDYYYRLHSLLRILDMALASLNDESQINAHVCFSLTDRDHTGSSCSDSVNSKVHSEYGKTAQQASRGGDALHIP